MCGAKPNRERRARSGQARLFSSSTVASPNQSEFDDFRGAPEEHCKFMKQFESFIESRMLALRNGLRYPLYQCRLWARKAIDGRSISEAVERYASSEKPLRLVEADLQAFSKFDWCVIVLGKVYQKSCLRRVGPIGRLRNCFIAPDRLGCWLDLDAIQISVVVSRYLPSRL